MITHIFVDSNPIKFIFLSFFFESGPHIKSICCPSRHTIYSPSGHHKFKTCKALIPIESMIPILMVEDIYFKVYGWQRQSLLENKNKYWLPLDCCKSSISKAHQTFNFLNFLIHEELSDVNKYHLPYNLKKNKCKYIYCYFI